MTNTSYIRVFEKLKAFNKPFIDGGIFCLGDKEYPFDDKNSTI